MMPVYCKAPASIRTQKDTIIPIRTLCTTVFDLFVLLNIARGDRMMASSVRTFHADPVINEALCDKPLENFASASAIKCMARCSTNDQCLSFSYSKTEQLCWLHKIVVSPLATGHHRNGAKCYNMMHGTCDADDGYMYEPMLNFCFKVYNISIEYHASKSRCLEDRAYLIRLDRMEEWVFLIGFLVQGENQYFIQSNYNTSVSQWQFDDGTQMHMASFLYQDYTGIHDESRLVLMQPFHWHRLQSTDSSPGLFVCQRLVKSHIDDVLEGSGEIFIWDSIGIPN